MKKSIIYPIFLLIFSFIAYASSGVIYSDSFTYPDAYINHGYISMSLGGCGSPENVNYPITSYFTTNSFGIEAYPSGCGFGYTRSLDTNITAKRTSGVLTFEYSLAVINDSSATNYPFAVQFLQDTVASTERIGFYHYNPSLITSCGSQSGCEECFLENLTAPYSSANFVIQLDLDNNMYYWYHSGDSGFNCSGRMLGLNGVFIIRFSTLVDGSEYLKVYADDFQLSSIGVNFTNGSLPDYAPCIEDTDCSTGKCENGYCVKKLGKESCEKDSDCLSGNCLNGVCAKPSTSQLLGASKNETFGNDTDTNNFVALIFVIGLPVLCLAYGKKNGVLPAILIYFGTALFFTLIGWLSPFILIGSFIAGIIMIFFTIAILRASG